MKRILTISALVAASLSCLSQSRYENDTLFTESGFKVYERQELNIGVGTTDDGDFKFIRQNSSGFGTMMTASSSNSYNKSEQSLRRTFAGHKGKVVKIVRRGSKKMGYTYEPLITFGSGRFEIDVDNAIRSGELKVPDEFLPKKEPIPVIVQTQISKADELTKLKKLLDDGVLTQTEYNAEKAKLLAQ